MGRNGAVFVRQGILLQVVDEAKTHKSCRSRLSSLASGYRNCSGGGGGASNGLASGPAANLVQANLYFLQQQFDHNHSHSHGHNHNHNQEQQASQTAASQPGAALSHLAQLAQRASSGHALEWTNQQQHHHQAHHSHSSKELVRQCFLFTNHLLLCTRTKEGKLRLLEVSSGHLVFLAKRQDCVRPKIGPTHSLAIVWALLATICPFAAPFWAPLWAQFRSLAAA